jgi:hypothetical protein
MATKTQFEAIETVEVLNDDLIDLLTMEALVVGHNRILVGLDPVGSTTMLGVRNVTDVGFEDSVYAYPTDLTVDRVDNGIGNEIQIRYGQGEQTTKLVELDVV